jgi:hypothetical protein
MPCRAVVFRVVLFTYRVFTVVAKHAIITQSILMLIDGYRSSVTVEVGPHFFVSEAFIFLNSFVHVCLVT